MQAADAAELRTSQKKEADLFSRPHFVRCLAESNRCSRFCRPVPNRSAKAPLFGNAKIMLFLLSANYFFPNAAECRHSPPKVHQSPPKVHRSPPKVHRRPAKSPSEACRKSTGGLPRANRKSAVCPKCYDLLTLVTCLRILICEITLSSSMLEGTEILMVIS